MLQLARPEDMDAVEQIAKQVHTMHVNWRPDIYEMPDQLYTPQRYAAEIASRQLYVAKQDKNVIGYLCFKIRNYDWPGVVQRKVLILDEIAVHEAYRHQGVGTQMLTDVKALGRAFGCSDIQLSVYPQNDNAVSFYQKNGLMIRSIDMQMKL